MSEPTYDIQVRQRAIIVAEIPGYGPDAALPADVRDDDDITSLEYAPWGSSNQQPKDMAALIEKCGVLNAALDAKARISVGKGIQPFLLTDVDSEGKETLQWVNDPEIQDWLEDNDLFNTMLDLSYDENAYGWSAGSLLMNKARNKINKLLRKDVYECRLERKDPKTLQINHLMLSAEWSGLGGETEVKRIPLLRDRDEYDHLNELMSKGGKPAELAFTNRRRRNGRQYYPQPLWYSAREWVKVAAEIPALKNAMFQNQMTIKYLVTISKMYWTENYPGWESMNLKDRQEIIQTKYSEIENNLIGTDKAYKTILSSTYVDPVTKQENPHIAIEVLDDKLKDGKLLPESSAANSEILFALAVNPALIGAGQPGGPYSNNAGGSNIREAYLTAMMMLEAERKMNSRLMTLIKRYNGWTRLETNGARLVWRFQSGLLTTLDTGKSTKAENL